MKIIGKTSEGYLCEVSKREMTVLTGKQERTYEEREHAHNIGATINVPDFQKHIDNMEATVLQRSNAAELLRSAANIIETVPAAFTAPPPTPARSAAQDLRDALA